MTDGEGLIHGLKLVAVAVVLQAVGDMARGLCPDHRRAAIALAELAALSVLTTAYAQVIVIALGAVLCFLFCRSTASAGRVGVREHAHEFRIPRAVVMICALADFTEALVK
jgi:chromate transporter